MDFRYSTEQDAFRASLHGFLCDAAPLATVREADGHDEQLWKRLCSELELPGLHVPLEYGGAGATLLETAIVFSELGHAGTEKTPSEAFEPRDPDAHVVDLEGHRRALEDMNSPRKHQLAPCGYRRLAPIAARRPNAWLGVDTWPGPRSR